MKKYKKRNPIAEKFLNFAEEHITMIVIIFVAAVIFAPIIVKHCYCCNVNRFFSSETMLTYIENTIMGLATFFAAVVALLVGQRSSIMQERTNEQNRIDEALPLLHLEIEKNTEKTYQLTLHNLTDKVAKDIYICEGETILPYLKGNETQTITIKFEKNSELEGFYIKDSNCFSMSDTSIEWIHLAYADIYDNYMGGTFKKNSRGYYISSDFKYYD